MEGGGGGGGLSSQCVDPRRYILPLILYEYALMISPPPPYLIESTSDL